MLTFAAQLIAENCECQNMPSIATFWRSLAQFYPAEWASLTCISIGFAVLPRQRLARLAALACLCLLAAGVWGAVWIALSPQADSPAHEYLPGAIPFLSSFWQINFGFATLLVVLREFSLRSRHAAEALHGQDLQLIAAQAQASQAHLNLLAAQIEPHFLFNALANVRRLLRTDSAAARSLIEDLLRYFEAALPRIRDPHSTLAREAELVRAYLAVHRVRMGGRLQVELDIPDDLSRCDVPAMALLTLVENAIKHGLQPMVDGGTIRVAARSTAGSLALSVADDGRGMGDGAGHGTGLVNLRARLKALHGAAASLSLRVNDPRGVVATIVLPQAGA
jgi:signal transduction histidine kinase